MPWYCFHVHVGGKIERDTFGLELSNLAEAIAAAQRGEDELD